MRRLVVPLLLLFGTVPTDTATIDDRDRVLALFASLPQRFLVERVDEEAKGRTYHLRSVRPAGAGDERLFLRASLSVARLADAESAAEEVGRRLSGANPDTGLSYAWDLVAAHESQVLHLWAACTLSEESFDAVVATLRADLDLPETASAFRCRCGGGCRAEEGSKNSAAATIPAVRRSPDIESEATDWDNRLDPSGSWKGALGELALMHSADRLAFSYLAVFGPNAHVCEGAGVAGLVGTDTYEWGDEQGSIAFEIDEHQVRMRQVEGITSFCGSGWAGETFQASSWRPPIECAVIAGRSRFHVVDHLEIEPRPAYVQPGDVVEVAPAHFTLEEKWVLARWLGPVMTIMGLLPRGDLDCPSAEMEDR